LITKKVDFIIEYLSAGAQMELFDEKKPEVEKLVTGTL
jgi:hypothetical protein